MHTPIVFDQTNCSGPLIYYNNTGLDEYLSDSDSYSNNESDCHKSNEKKSDFGHF
jgi:hypothetical protein